MPSQKPVSSEKVQSSTGVAFRRLAYISAIAGGVASLTLLGVRYAWADGFASLFGWHLERMLAAASDAASRSGLKGAAFEAELRAEYLPYATRHFLDHASWYFGVTAVGFGAVLLALQPRQRLLRVSSVVRAFALLVLVTPPSYFALTWSAVPALYGAAVAALLVLGAWRARPAATAAPSTKAATRSALARTASWLAVSAFSLSASALLLPIWIFARGAPEARAAPTVERPVAAHGAPLVDAAPPKADSLAAKLIGTWQRDPTPELESLRKQALDAEELKRVERDLSWEANRTWLTFRADYTLTREDAPPASLPEAGLRIGNDTWQVVERAGAAPQLRAGRELVDFRFIGKDALEIGRERWRRRPKPNAANAK